MSKKALIFVTSILIVLVTASLYLFESRKIAPVKTGKEEIVRPERQQMSMEDLPLNSTRGFTLQIGEEKVYFEFVNLEVIKDLEDMLFMPNEKPNNTVIDRFEDNPFIACMKFSFRVRASDFPEIMIEMFDEKVREWKGFMTLLTVPSLAAEQGGALDSILVTQDGDRFDIYWGAHFPPIETPLWFRGIDEDIRLHAILSIEIPEGAKMYHTGDVLYQAGNLTVVYERILEEEGALHVYIEPFELPYVKFKVEDAKFLSASELELTLRNAGNLPLIGRMHWGNRDSVSFHLFPAYLNPIIVVNGEEFDISTGYVGEIPKDPKHIINLPKPWEIEGWAVIIYPDEMLELTIFPPISENKVIVKGQEGKITLHAKPVPQRILNIDADAFEYNLDFHNIVVDVRNEGDSPFFAEKAEIDVLIDGREIPLDRAWGIIPTGEIGEMELWLEEGKNSINYKELVEGFTVKVSIDGREIVYDVPPLAPKIEVMGVKTHILWEDVCDGIVINITNNWIFPIEAKWVEVYAEGKSIKYYTEPSYCVVYPGKTETFTINFVDDVRIGSTVEVKLGLTSVKVKV